MKTTPTAAPRKDTGGVLLAKETARRKTAEVETYNLRAQVAKLLRERDAREREDEKVLAATSLRLKPFKIPVNQHLPGAPGMPMTIWSDWHWGEVVSKAETGGYNVFNRRIAYDRVSCLLTNTVDILRNYAGPDDKYPGIWICLGGDMVSGSIHDELRETNWGTVEEQAHEVGDVLAGALERMADEFGKVWVPCVCGNHGRNAKRPPAKQAVKENREWGIYKSLERYFRNDDRITFYIPEEIDYHWTVYGHRFLLTHGDRLGVKGGDGIIGAIGPIARGAVKIGRSQAQIGRDFDTMVIGHWHSLHGRGDLLPVVINGSLKGYDEYAMNVLRAPYAPPRQALWLVSPKRGIAGQWAVDCF
jgi:hypothetical protein